MTRIPQKYLVAAVVVIGLYSPVRAFIRHFTRHSMSFQAANIVLFVLFSLSMAICIIGARSLEYRTRWVVFGVISVLGLVLLSSPNAVAMLYVLGRIVIW